MRDKKEENSNRAFAAGAVIYNVTTRVEGGIAEEWLQWMLDEHIPEVMKTDCFADYRVVRLLDVDDAEGPTYAIQYSAESKADYNRYIELFASQMSKRSFEKWRDRFISFGSVMEIVK